VIRVDRTENPRELANLVASYYHQLVSRKVPGELIPVLIDEYNHALMERHRMGMITFAEENDE
jgi:hypothetical protein